MLKHNKVPSNLADLIEDVWESSGSLIVKIQMPLNFWDSNMLCKWMRQSYGVKSVFVTSENIPEGLTPRSIERLIHQ